MIATVLLLQIALPVILLVWAALWPASSSPGLALQAAGTGTFLFALPQVAQWALPVWWLPLVYGAAWLGAVLLAALVRLGLGGLAPWPTGGWH